jgi:hypothetical protein
MSFSEYNDSNHESNCNTSTESNAGTEPLSIAEIIGKLDRLQVVAGGWIAACPAHQDDGASLSITQINEYGDVTIRCNQGCSAGTVEGALNIPDSQQIENLDGSFDICTPRPPRTSSSSAKGISPRKDDEKNKSDVKKLLELVQDAECFPSQYGEPYISILINGHHENYPIDRKDFEWYLNGKFYRANEERTPSAEDFRSAIKQLSAKARFGSKARTVYVRVAKDVDSVYIDLGDAEWQAIKVTADRWGIIFDPPVVFRRPAGMLPLPSPTPGASLSELREYLYLGSDYDWKLIVSWLLASVSGITPYPILIMIGPQGSAKSTNAKILRNIVDPGIAPLRSTPHDERDLIISAKNGCVLAFDNISGLQPFLADAFCRLATGGGYGTRRLYTDSDEALFSGARPICLNGIEPVSDRADLLDRAIVLELPPMSDHKRRTEQELFARFTEAWPRILAALLDALVVGLRNLPSTKLNSPPRMADFATLVVAAEPALPWASGGFLEAYGANRRDAMESSVEDEPVVHAVEKYFGLEEVDDSQSNPQQLIGTPAQIMGVLTMIAASESGSRPPDWPKSVAQFSIKLRRIALGMRARGFDVEFKKTNGARLIYIRRTVPRQPITVPCRPCAVPADPVPTLPPPKQLQEKAGKKSNSGTARDGRDGRVSKTSPASLELTLEDIVEE